MDYVPLTPIYWRTKAYGDTGILGTKAPPNGYVCPEIVPILLARKGKTPRYVDIELANQDMPMISVRNKWHRQLWDDIPLISKDQQDYVLIPEVPHRLIRMFSLFGETVLDPFMGQSAIGEHAISLGRSFTGIEYDTSLQPTIKERMQKVVEGVV
tara:strand:- start:23 stop:487 length:465 start_codon:yes stop_codon:yes gene_type:complete